jgi:hypothetical protein
MDGFTGHGSGRTPGPLGSSTLVGGRIPGPQRRRPVRVADAKPLSKKTFEMPNPGPGDSGRVRVHAVEWKLFDGGVSPSQVRQGRLANCPLASILAALANTKVGRTRIDNILKAAERHANVETNLSGVLDKLDNDPESPTPKKITSKRYFALTLAKNIETSDAFYTDNVDRDWNLFYMQHNEDRRIENRKDILWPAVIEKAYAVQRGGYDKISESKDLTLAVVWKDIAGKNPDGLKLEDKTDKEILDVVKAAGNVPAVAASRKDSGIETDSSNKLTDDHGYAVLGLQGSKIELYNPWGWKVSVSMKELRKYFELIQFGNP